MQHACDLLHKTSYKCREIIVRFVDIEKAEILISKMIFHLSHLLKVHENPWNRIHCKKFPLFSIDLCHVYWAISQNVFRRLTAGFHGVGYISCIYSNLAIVIDIELTLVDTIIPFNDENTNAHCRANLLVALNTQWWCTFLALYSAFMFKSRKGLWHWL